jgi:hypothetical protein
MSYSQINFLFIDVKDKKITKMLKRTAELWKLSQFLFMTTCSETGDAVCITKTLAKAQPFSSQKGQDRHPRTSVHT